MFAPLCPSMCRGIVKIVLVTSVLGFAACAARPPLLDERRVEPYAGLVARYDAADRRDGRVAVTPEGGPTVAVGVHELRAPDASAAREARARPVLVLLPGILSDVTTWRFLAGALVDTYDVVMLDPPGVGTSDRPMPPAGGDALYTPTWLAECAGLALRDWQGRQPAPRRLVLVGHSLGGTVVLRLLASPALGARLADVVSRVEGAVLLAPADLALREASPLLAEIRDTPAWKARLGCALGVVQRQTAKAVHDGVVCPQDRALAEEACRLSATLCDPCSLAAAQWMLRRFQPVDACGAPDLAAADRLAAQERSIGVPLLVLWGAQDDTLPLATSGPLLARLPRAKRVVVDGAKHSLHQEQVARVAAEIRAFLTIAPAPRHGRAVNPAAALGLAALVGVLLGSIPVAWLLVRWRTGADVAREGSGNVGALNASRVSRSRGLGVAVLGLDAAKGIAAVLFARACCPAAHADLVAGVGAVAGHDYNPWLSWAQGRLVGGKGFATATGVVSLTCPWCLPAWLAVVVLAYALARRVAGLTDEAPATALATALLPAMAYGLYGGACGLAGAAMAALILPKHVGDLRTLARARPVGRG